MMLTSAWLLPENDQQLHSFTELTSLSVRPIMERLDAVTTVLPLMPVLTKLDIDLVNSHPHNDSECPHI